jgi:hypothetical protein
MVLQGEQMLCLLSGTDTTGYPFEKYVEPFYSTQK